ncbi:MAG TPA: cytochrome ubiquinol oxidase subunit I [Solirubrobacteraceae bacterium]|nr:cytochrome ubiquinol oxidase subunit I [Solirubrobacteraceae bacterium]
MANELARWQFATTSIYHFLFVPVTIGLAFLVAILQTAWYRNGRPEYRSLCRFFGVLLLINVAVGVVSGLVQEFEFGMNWSAYARYVGDVFGGPLAMEGLAAFFLESTFLGAWLFGWDRLPKAVHLATIWCVAAGTILSAAFIMAANSWMQHPVGYAMHNGKPELNNIGAVFTNPTFLWGYVHVILAAFITGALVMLAVSAWQILRGKSQEAFTLTAKLSIFVLVPATVLTMFVGSELGVIEAKYQPMKIAAAEAQWETCKPCGFSLIQVGGGAEDKTPSQIIEIPHLLSLLATNSWNGEVKGLNQLQAEYEKKYGPGNYVPDVFIQYWSMRIMAYLAGLVLLLALWAGWLLHRGTFATSKRFLRLSIYAVVTPFLMNTAGWMLTENGRQPWIVQGLMKTINANSPNVTSAEVWISLVAFVLIYAALAAADVYLMLRYARKGLPAQGEEEGGGADKTAIPGFAY